MKKFFVFLCAMFVLSAHADTETVNWYKDGQTYAQTTCTVGGDITLPTTPTKRGYNFTGWTVALYDFSTLDYTVNGDGSYDETAQTWLVSFLYGNISGMALCSITPAVWGIKGFPDETTSGGTYCWCRATGFVPYGDNIIYKPQPQLFWIGFADNATNALCASNCAKDCLYRIRTNREFRAAIFGIQ